MVHHFNRLWQAYLALWLVWGVPLSLAADEKTSGPDSKICHSHLEQESGLASSFSLSADPLESLGKLDPQIGAEALATLHRANAFLEVQIAQGKTWDDIENSTFEGLPWVEWADPEDNWLPGENKTYHPHMLTQGTGDNQQVEPFRAVKTPLAYSGFLLPVKKVKQTRSQKKKGEFSPRDIDPLFLTDQYSDIFILVPGIGFKRSQATSLLGVSGTLRKGIDYIGKTIPIPIDAPMNGLGSDAPDAFATAEGNLAVLRHIHLLMTLRFPGKKVVIGGRSQGGLVALSYGQAYSRGDHGLYAVVAVNPSSPDPQMIDWVDRKYRSRDETSARLEGLSTMADMVPRAWMGHNQFTSDYQVFDKTTQVPSLLLLGEQDHSYSQPTYLQSMEGFAAQDNLRQAMIFDGPHDLWSQRNRALYDSVLLSMGRYLAEQRRAVP